MWPAAAKRFLTGKHKFSVTNSLRKSNSKLLQCQWNYHLLGVQWPRWLLFTVYVHWQVVTFPVTLALPEHLQMNLVLKNFNTTQARKHSVLTGTYNIKCLQIYIYKFLTYTHKYCQTQRTRYDILKVSTATYISRSTEKPSVKQNTNNQVYLAFMINVHLTH